MTTVRENQPAEIAVVTVNEGNVAVIGGTLLDEAGDAIAAASLSAFTLTLYDRATDTIINSRNAQSVLNTNGGTLHATSGAFTLTLSSDDNPILSTSLAAGRTETHIALLEATWSGGGYWSGLIRVQVRQVHRSSTE